MELRKGPGPLLVGVYLWATFCSRGCHGGMYQRKLYHDLMLNYNRLERPVLNDSAPIVVELGFTLRQIIDVDEKNQVLITNAWLQLYWTDVYLSWNPESYPGVQNLRFPSSLIWMPDILLYNRKLLIARCQREFQNKEQDERIQRKQEELDAAKNEADRTLIRSEIEELTNKDRRNFLGNVKFIGELFKLNMLKESVMHSCVVHLLKDQSEESLEGLCKILQTIGKNLDSDTDKSRMDKYFSVIQRISTEKQTSTRIRFMLEDMLDLRKNNWVPRRKEEGPRKISENQKEMKVKTQRATAPTTPKTSCIVQKSFAPITEDNRKLFSSLFKPTEQQQNRTVNVNNKSLQQTENAWKPRTIEEAESPKKMEDTHKEANMEMEREKATKIDNCQNDKSSSAPSEDDGTLESNHTPEQQKEEIINENSSDTLHKAANAWKPRRLREQKSPEKTVETHDEGNVEMERKLSPKIASFQKDKSSSAPSEEKGRSESDHTPEQPKKEMVNVKSRYTLHKAANPWKPRRFRVEAEAEDNVASLQKQESPKMNEEIHKKASLETETKVASKTSIYGPARARGCEKNVTVEDPIISRLLNYNRVPQREQIDGSSNRYSEKNISGQEKERIHNKEKPVKHKNILPPSPSRSPSPPPSTSSPPPSSPSPPHSPSPSPTHDKTTFSEDDGKKLKLGLERLLLEKNTDQEVIGWIQKNFNGSKTTSNQFIRTLTTSVCQSAVAVCGVHTVDFHQLESWSSVLRKYLCDPRTQMEALNTLQDTMVKMGHPKHLLWMIFISMLEMNIIQEEVFVQWKRNGDPANQPGKDSTLKSVSTFFSELEEFARL